MNGAQRRPIRLVAVLAAVLAGMIALVGAASATPAEPPDPPGPIQDLVLTPTGSGARGAGFDASWSPPTENGGGIRLHYVVRATDGLGKEVVSTATGATSIDRYHGDYCRGPFTVSVKAVTQDPATGAPIAGPEVLGTVGHTTLCELTMSATATRTGPGAVQVVVHREPPVDPYVAGPCVLTANGRQVWTGTCGGGYADRTIAVDGLAPDHYDLVLTATSPHGEDYTARTSVDVR